MSNNKQQTAVEWQFEQLFNSFEKFNNDEYTFDEYLKRNLEIREQAKEIEKDQMELAIIKQCAEQSTSEASSYADGYSEGYKRALEYMYQVIYTQIKIKE